MRVLTGLRTFASAGLVVALAALLGGCDINAPVRLEEEAKAKWSQVSNQYQRRADLIPNLVETVKGAANFERQTLEAVVNARARATQMQLPADILTNPEAFKKFQESQAQLSSALARLLVVSEQYPDLKANQQFLALQSQLEGTENRIAVARRDYIEAVKAYNTLLRSVPQGTIARMIHSDLQAMQTFTIDEATKQVPQVKFN